MSEAKWPEMARKTGRGPAAPPRDPPAAPRDPPASRRDRVIEALLGEPTFARAAASAGVPLRTLRRWVREPSFRSAWMAARRDAFGQAIGLTQKYAPLAVGTLVKVMNDAAATPGARVTAAAMLLKFAREGIEIDDLAERVAALERGIPSVGSRPGDDEPENDEAEEKP